VVAMIGQLPFVSSCRRRSHGNAAEGGHPLALFRRWSLATLLAVCLPAAARAEGQAREVGWNVVTLARNGAWGAASADLQGHAIAAALRKCVTMAKQQSDCGAEFAIIKGGWVVALRCGDHRVLGTGGSLEAAEKAALSQEKELRAGYSHELPLCQRILTVDPDGVVTAAKATLPIED
jgi:hypothetical protein